jgi:hypothetical protein
MRAGSFVAASLFGAFCVASPAAAGPPFLTDDPEPVDLGHWEVIGFSMGTVVRGDSAGTLPGVEVNYGALPGLQLHVKVPVSFNSQSVTGTESGYGDTEFGAKYRFINPGEDDWWPQVAVYPAVDLRTGNVPRGLGTGATHMFLPLWMQKDLASGRAMAVADTGSILDRETEITGSLAGNFSVRSPTTWCLAPSCFIKLPRRAEYPAAWDFPSAVKRQPDLTSAEPMIFPQIITCCSRLDAEFRTQRRPTNSPIT